MIHERAPVLVGEPLVLPRRATDQDHEIPRRELAREIVRPNACDELYAAVGVGLPREVPRGDDPRVAEVLVVFPYELAHERVNRVALDVIARDQFIADASRPGVPLFPFCHRCLLRE